MKGEREVAGMKCGEVLSGLSAYLDDELTPERRTQVEAHLGGCDTCERFGGEMGRVVAAVRAWRSPATPAGMADRLRESFRKQRDAE